MKFSYKITCGMGAIIALVFSVGGYLLIDQNFQMNVETMKKQASNQHQMERYTFLTALERTVGASEEVKDVSIIAALRPLEKVISQKDHTLCVLEDAQQIYCGSQKNYDYVQLEHSTNVIDQTSLSLDPDTSQLAVMTPIQAKDRVLVFLSVYDVSSLYEQRLDQLNYFLFLNITICLAALGLVWMFTNHLTKPIRKLTKTTKTILAGTYEACEIHTKDEIGELADSFNQMSASLADKIQELEESSRQKDAFMASFTHEIKTPMTTIIGYSDLLRKSLCDETGKQEAYEFMFREGKRLEELSTSLLQLYMSDHAQLELEALPIRDFLEQLVHDMEYQFPDAKLQLVMPEQMVVGTGLLLDVLIRNVIKNAILAKGNPISIIGIKREHTLCIQVKDHGCGISEADLKQIKEPFYRVDRSRSRASGGNGIGLALCEKIAQLHGTTLTFESTLGEGTTVSFELLLAAEESI